MVKGQWEERFERRFGFWRGCVEEAVFAFLDCGIYEHGFARVVCDNCRVEFLVAFSCQRRGLCPSCAAKRGAIFGASLAEEVLDEVGHVLWTFTIPKMLRPGCPPSELRSERLRRRALRAADGTPTESGCRCPSWVRAQPSASSSTG